MLTRRQIRMLVHRHGREIIAHENMMIERRCYQHGAVTTFAHAWPYGWPTGCGCGGASICAR